MGFLGEKLMKYKVKTFESSNMDVLTEAINKEYEHPSVENGTVVDFKLSSSGDRYSIWHVLMVVYSVKNEVNE